MTVIYSRNESQVSPEIDLVRDFEILTHDISDAERAQLLDDIREYVLNNRDHPEKLKFASPELLMKTLQNLTQVCDGLTGFFCSSPEYLNKVVSKAQFLQNNLRTLRFERGGLFYDLNEREESYLGLQSTTLGVDYYLQLREDSLEDYSNFLFDYLELGQITEHSTSEIFTQGAMHDQTRNFFDESAANGRIKSHGASHEISTNEMMDVSGIPFELFDDSSLDFSSDDVLLVMDAMLPVPSVEERHAIIQQLLQMSSQQVKGTAPDSVADFLAVCDLIGEIFAVERLSADELILQVSQFNERLHIMNRERQKLKIPTLDKEQHIQKITRTLVDAPLEEWRDQYSVSLSDVLTAINELSYLNSGQILEIMTLILQSGGDLRREASCISGLAYQDIKLIYAHIANPKLLDQKFSVSKVFEFYYSQHHEDRFELHAEKAAAVIEADERLDWVTPEMASLVMTVESRGEASAVSETTGAHFGLMQIGVSAYEQITGKSVTPEELKATVTGRGWPLNIEIGVRYLQWCFDYFNPTHSPAVAFGNYNWGCDSMQKYRHFAMYGRKTGVTLNNETRDYVTKYISYQRLLHKAASQN